MAKRGLRSIGINKIIPAQIDFTQIVSGSAAGPGSFVALSSTGTPVLVNFKNFLSQNRLFTSGGDIPATATQIQSSVRTHTNSSISKKDTFLIERGDAANGPMLGVMEGLTVEQLAYGMADGSTITATNGVLTAVGGGASGDITGVTAGDGLSGGGNTGAVSLAVSVDDATIEINSDTVRAKTAAIANGGTGLATADQIHTFVTTQTDAMDADTAGNAATATKLAASVNIAGVAFDGSQAISLNNNAITNGAGYTTNTGDITGVDLTGGTGIDIGSETNTTSGDYSATISVDVSDFMTNGSNNRIVTATGADAQNAEANLTFDGSTLYANGKVGIGQSTPPKTLTVEFTDDDTTVASGRTLAAGGTGDGVLIENISTTANAYANLDFKVGSGDARIAAVHDGSSNTSIHFATEVNANTFSSDLVISSGGKVGIATTSPSNTLQVNIGGGDGDNGILIVRDDASTGDTNILGGLGFDSSDGNVPSSILEASAYVAAIAAEDHGVGDKGGDLVFGTAPIDQDDDTTSSERMRITSEGNVGVGTTSPKHFFHVAGQGYFTRTGIGDSHVRKTLTVAFTGSDSTVATGENLVQSAYGDGNGNGVLIHNAGSTVNSYANLDFRSGTADARIALVFKNANDGDFHFVTKNNGNAKSSMVIQSDGKVGIGSTTPTGPLHTVDESSDGYLRIDNNVDNSAGNGIYFRKSRGSAASKTVVQENDQLGALWFLGYNDDGTAYTAAAAIVATVDGEPSTSTDSTDMPGRLEFRTAPDGSSTAQNRMVIKENGRIAIGGETSWDPSHTVHINDDSITLLALESPGADGANGPQQAFYKSRGSVGSETVVQEDDILGEMVFYGYDGTNYEKSAQILVKVDGEPATSSDPTDMPSRIEFATSLDGNVNNTTRMTIKNNGAVGIGTTTPSGQLHVADVGGLSISTTGRLGVGCEPSYYDLQVVDDGGYALVAFDSYIDQAFGSHLYLRHARGTESSPTVVQEGDRLGGIVFQGYNPDGTAHDTAAAIYAIVDGEPSTSTDNSDMPGRLEFRCSPDGESTAGVKMVIKSDGKVGIGTDAPKHTLDVPGVGGLVVAQKYLHHNGTAKYSIPTTMGIPGTETKWGFVAPSNGMIELTAEFYVITSTTSATLSYGIYANNNNGLTDYVYDIEGTQLDACEIGRNPTASTGFIVKTRNILAGLTAGTTYSFELHLDLSTSDSGFMYYGSGQTPCVLTSATVPDNISQTAGSAGNWDNS